MHCGGSNAFLACRCRICPFFFEKSCVACSVLSYWNALIWFFFTVAEWWSTYGGSCPNLVRLATRILGQTCSSIEYKRSQIPFEQLHDTKNCLERQRLSDLVFVQCNLRLRQMSVLLMETLYNYRCYLKIG